MSKKTFLDIIKDEEEKYVFNKYSSVKLSKQKQIDQLLQTIKLQESFGNEGHHAIILDQLKKISLSKGGFLSNENRIIIYQYILNVYQPQDVQLTSQEWDIVDQDADIIMNDNKRSAYEKPPQDWGIIDRSSDIIMNDCKRSVIFRILTHNKWLIDSKDKSITQFVNELNSFIVTVITPIKEFKYYQGYHNLALYFLLLFGKEKGVILFRTFTKQFIYCYMDNKESINNERLFSNISQKVIERNKDMKDYVGELFTIHSNLVLNWVSTWFTNNNNSLFLQFRLIDYLICSKNDDFIMSFCTVLLDEEFNKLKSSFAKNKLEDKQLYEHFNQLQIESNDIEKLINEAEKVLKKKETDYFQNESTNQDSLKSLKKYTTKRNFDLKTQKKLNDFFIIVMVLGIIMAIFIELCYKYH